MCVCVCLHPEFTREQLVWYPWADKRKILYWRGFDTLWLNRYFLCVECACLIGYNCFKSPCTLRIADDIEISLSLSYVFPSCFAWKIFSNNKGAPRRTTKLPLFAFRRNYLINHAVIRAKVTRSASSDLRIGLLALCVYVCMCVWYEFYILFFFLILLLTKHKHSVLFYIFIRYITIRVIRFSSIVLSTVVYILFFFSP